MMSRDHLQISGKVLDKKGELRCVLKGYWDEKIEYCEVLGGSEMYRLLAGNNEGY